MNTMDLHASFRRRGCVIEIESTVDGISVTVARPDGGEAITEELHRKNPNVLGFTKAEKDAINKAVDKVLDKLGDPEGPIIVSDASEIKMGKSYTTHLECIGVSSDKKKKKHKKKDKKKKKDKDKKKKKDKFNTRGKLISHVWG